ncbi:S41 family peptidase [Sphingomonas sp.]|uniref:S41 family peptidase n=1 Tax=Sphingomonas sp. TaxID=28214 RepID=UPI001DE59071|nr:S41 family peptidase [Sphingomonas sp.]MBX9797771.1 peptidase S41 [Sphingomonas sp.]
MDRRQLITGLATLPLIGAAAPAGYADDVAIVRAAMALHPGLYRYASPRAVADGLDRLAATWPGASQEARYLALSRFLATLRCGHSYASFFNQKRRVVSALFDRPTRLPFHFRWLDGQMVVIAGLDSGLAPGTRITRVNGVASDRLLAQLMPYTRADGHNDGKRRALLEVRGVDTVEFFDVFQGLLAPPPGGEHHVTGVAPDGRPVDQRLPAIGLAARRAAMPKAADDGDGARWTWAMRGDVALLTMPGWAVYNSKWDWLGWLNDRLDSLGGARGLVIDLRDNEGGLDCGDPILARLVERDLPPPGYEQRLRYRRTPAELDRYLDTWDNSFRTMGVGGAALADGFIARPGGNDASTIRPDARRLNLPVATLISPTNSSAAFHFALMGRASGKVRLFGETTGGNRRGINGGAFFFVRLPESGLEFDLPLVGYFATTPQPDAGVAPDVPVALTAADIAAGRDPVLDAALGWIARA